MVGILAFLFWKIPFPVVVGLGPFSFSKNEVFGKKLERALFPKTLFVVFPFSSPFPFPLSFPTFLFAVGLEMETKLTEFLQTELLILRNNFGFLYFAVILVS